LTTELTVICNKSTDWKQFPKKKLKEFMGKKLLRINSRLHFVELFLEAFLRDKLIGETHDFPSRGILDHLFLV